MARASVAAASLTSSMAARSVLLLIDVGHSSVEGKTTVWPTRNGGPACGSSDAPSLVITAPCTQRPVDAGHSLQPDELVPSGRARFYGRPGSASRFHPAFVKVGMKR